MRQPAWLGLFDLAGNVAELLADSLAGYGDPHQCWGVPGGLIAVPMLSALKITFQHVPSLVPLARLLD